jgi:uncharacterized protein YcaQ
MRSVTAARARQYMLDQLALNGPWPRRGGEGARALLRRLRCVQIDPLDPLGNNAELVVLARVDGLPRAELWAELSRGAFEHFAKERCLLPGDAFPWYRAHAAAHPHWRQSERLKRLPERVLGEVLAEVEARGPLTAAQMSDHGRVDPIDWSGWKGTSKAATMALEVLTLRAQVVVCGRRGKHHLFDLPQRALSPAHLGPAEGDFDRLALLDRVEAAGLLMTQTGPQWGALQQARQRGLPAALVREGALEQVQIEGSTRRFLAPAGAFERDLTEPDDRLRILGPLDPLLWDRELVKQLFGFTYLWEVYKPAAQRRWGWYVCPLLHRGQLVGRLEGRAQGGALTIARIWPEPGQHLDLRALDDALERHAAALGCASVTRPDPG